ncbi:TPA: hypothetical protein ACF3R9_003272, partial [Serratia marcescens]
TTETLNDFIAGKGFGVAPSAVEAMAHELLANREAQPVEVRRALFTKISNRPADESGNIFYCVAAGEMDLLEAILTAQPAPAVPGAISTRQAIVKMESHEPCESINVAYKLGWNACRAAMLAQPVSSGYKLPDGWKMVPVDPTKEMINAALASGAISIRTAYSAMLAAAPEGGNG